MIEKANRKVKTKTIKKPRKKTMCASVEDTVVAKNIGTGRKVGHPLKYDNVEEMQAIIDAYFEECALHTIRVTLKDGSVEERESPKVPTVSGLAFLLDMSRKQLIEYNEREEYRNAISRAKRYIESIVEEKLFVPGLANGVTFNLKNNFQGWKDKSEVDNNVNGELGVNMQILNFSKPKQDGAAS